MKKIIFCLIAVFLYGGSFQAYKQPPSASSYGYVPTISDEMMQECVRVYNEAENLQNSLNSTSVNRYSAYEVNEYNAKVRRASQMIDWFNANCAGKQSYSACMATMELNKKAGLPYQNCY